jgi:hypothetical protein
MGGVVEAYGHATGCYQWRGGGGGAGCVLVAGIGTGIAGQVHDAC